MSSTSATATAARPANTYAPPVATSSPKPAAPLPYFEVGVGKFVAMTIVTLGLYEVYWAYHQWTRIRARTSEIFGFGPIWRAAFAGYWNYWLFERIRADATARGIPIEWTSAYLSLVYGVLLVLWQLPDLWSLVSVFTFLPLIPVVQTVTAIHDSLEAERERNARFSGADIVGLVFGGAFVLLIILGTL